MIYMFFHQGDIHVTNLPCVASVLPSNTSNSRNSSLCNIENCVLYIVCSWTVSLCLRDD